ncbi:PREDICTED: enoyl-CoA delta isomerase 2, mitochondrial [Rhagoletis zephyria]|uniref:enoyl-CoA delta isomerase 2, mitochondrial n=1 Tax=Rhagoletis zephyria TaxID=28612 RepID=UPI0008114D4D|nr:PREDICTED: enoyl-CoA delta isomerase 2, mitochondrial [Rhagoletis zephyria]
MQTKMVQDTMDSYQGYTEIRVEKREKILLITFDNPKKRNSINRNGYKELGRVLREVADDNEVTIVVFTGNGDYFTSGNDLTQSANSSSDIELYIKESNNIFKGMIRALIDCPKPTLSLVNGPCIGVGATLTALCDIAWCSSTAYFLTPFTKLGIVPEGCSSYLFALILGRSKASEMLLMSEKLTAEEAYHYNFVSKVFDLTELDTVVWPKIIEFSELPPDSLRVSKSLMRLNERDVLYRTLDAENEELYKRFFSEEFANAVIAFATRKKRSKL